MMNGGNSNKQKFQKKEVKKSNNNSKGDIKNISKYSC